MISNGEIVIGILIFVVVALSMLYQRSQQQPETTRHKSERVPRHW